MAVGRALRSRGTCFRTFPGTFPCRSPRISWVRGTLGRWGRFSGIFHRARVRVRVREGNTFPTFPNALIRHDFFRGTLRGTLGFDALTFPAVTCTVTSVPAADVEGAVLAKVQKLLAAPELVARTWATAKREGDEITERDVTVLLADFATVWSELFPPEQARIVQLLVERVDVQEDAIEVRIRAEGLASLIGELRQQGERMAA